MQTSSPSVERPVAVEAELELRVGEDHAALARVRGDRLVDGDRDVAQPLGQLARADELGRRGQVDRLVVALVRLRRRGEDRLRQLLGLLQPGGQLDPGDGAGGLVVLPARAGDVAAHDALDREHLEPLDAQRAAAQLGGHAVGGRDRWLGTIARVRSNQSTESPVRTLPLSGISVGWTTS